MKRSLRSDTQADLAVAEASGTKAEDVSAVMAEHEPAIVIAGGGPKDETDEDREAWDTVLADLVEHGHVARAGRGIDEDPYVYMTRLVDGTEGAPRFSSDEIRAQMNDEGIHIRSEDGKPVVCYDQKFLDDNAEIIEAFRNNPEPPARPRNRLR